MSKAEEFLREHGHITEMTGNYPHRTEKSYIISDKTLHELMRVFAEQYAAEVSRETAIEFALSYEVEMIWEMLGEKRTNRMIEVLDNYNRDKVGRKFDNWIKEQEEQ